MLPARTIIRPDDEVLCGLGFPKRRQTWVRYGDVLKALKVDTRDYDRARVQSYDGSFWAVGQVRRKIKEG